MRASAGLLTLGSVVLAIDPQYARNYTVYHVNPEKYGAIPINMDTGDDYGDMFFDLHNAIAEPLECPNGAASGPQCSNPEVNAPALVVNKLTLTMDSRFSGYAKVGSSLLQTRGCGRRSLLTPPVLPLPAL
jgi:hypothetical protein